tara:strand:+ start:2608 stop:3660 length:1053 start_codon:yes stop_codon:yes gene_type:complete
MSPKREGDMPSFMRMSSQVKQVAIELAAEHLAASSFLGSPEILLNQGDTDSQWSTMWQEMMDDTYIPEVDRSYLHNQRENLKKWIAISTTEIRSKASKKYPDISLEAQVVELPQGRGRGRPSLEPEEVERRRLEREASPTFGRGRGRPAMTEEEKADAAAQRLIDPSRPRLGRPSGTIKKLPPPDPNVKIINAQRMRKAVDPIERVELEAAKLVGQDPRTQLKVEALTAMLSQYYPDWIDDEGNVQPGEPKLTQERYNEKMTELLGDEDWKYGLDVVTTPKSSTVPAKPVRLFVQRPVVDESKDAISSMEDLQQFLSAIRTKQPQDIEEELPVIEQSILEEEPDDPRLYQ